MPKLYDAASNRLIGEVSQADVDLLAAQFEEESSSDRDYYVNQGTLELLVEAGASPLLQAAIRSAFDGNGEADIRWETGWGLVPAKKRSPGGDGRGFGACSRSTRKERRPRRSDPPRAQRFRACTIDPGRPRGHCPGFWLPAIIFGLSRAVLR